ncbi:MAG: tetratricopeptide repeat protein [Candidatus Omnitrophica bacterium]|nr:tetratricopeptide repeat protein [Candidatus Omnitrophota bacterium]MCM8825983.1 tetratricopeptide repeat protein [Candidatus Omnitrophota bacterium]
MKRINLAILLNLIIFLGFIYYPLYAQEKINNEDRYFNHALSCFNDNFYDISLSLFEKFVNNYPNSYLYPLAKFYMAKSLYFKGDYKRAKDIFKEMLTNKEVSWTDEINYWLGITSLLNGEYEEAILYAKEVIKKFPNSNFLGKAYFLLAQGYIKMHRIDKAKIILEKILVNPSDKEVVVLTYDELLGLFYYIGDYHRLKILAHSYLNDYPQEGLIDKIHFYLGEVYYREGFLDEAIEEYSYCLGKKTIYSKLAYEKIIFSLMNKSYLNKLNNYIEKIGVENDELLYRGFYYSAIKEYSQALDNFEKFIKLNGENIDFTIYFAQAECLYKVGRINDAISIYNLLIEDLLDKYSYDMEGRVVSYKDRFIYRDILERAYYGRGLCYFQKSETNRALQDFLFITHNSFNPSLKFNASLRIADTYYEAGRFEDSAKLYSELIKDYSQNTHYEHISFYLALSLLNNNRIEEAERELKKLKDNFVSWEFLPQVDYYLAYVHFSQGNIEEAESILLSFMDNYSQHPWLDRVYYLLSKCFITKGRYDEAKRFLELLMSVTKDSKLKDLAYIDKANILTEQGRFSEALTVYEQIIKGKSKFLGEALFRKAIILRQMRNYQQAVEHLREAIYRGLDSSQVRLILGLCLEKLDRYEEAIKEYSLITEEVDSQEKIKAYFRIAKIYEKKNNWEEARKIYQKIIAGNYDEAKVAKKRLGKLENIKSLR